VVLPIFSAAKSWQVSLACVQLSHKFAELVERAVGKRLRLLSARSWSNWTKGQPDRPCFGPIADIGPFAFIVLIAQGKCFTSRLRIDLYSAVSSCALVKHRLRRSAHRIQAALGVCTSPAIANCTACATSSSRNRPAPDGKVSRDQCPLYPRKRTCAVH
jgi:hypothetical protein